MHRQPYARAANADLPWPDESNLALWHAIGVLLEHRGDGHIAALQAAGLDPYEALVSIAAIGAAPQEIFTSRGRSEQEWLAAATLAGRPVTGLRRCPQGRRAADRVGLRRHQSVHENDQQRAEQIRRRGRHLVVQKAGRIDTGFCGHRVVLHRVDLVGLSKDHAEAVLRPHATPINRPVGTPLRWTQLFRG